MWPAKPVSEQMGLFTTVMPVSGGEWVWLRCSP